MKVLRLAVLTLTFSSFSFAVNKDMVEMQRELEARLDAMQQTLNSKIDVLTGMLQAIQNDSRRTADQVASMQDTLTNGVAKSLAPVNGVSTKVDAMGDDVRSLKDSLADLSARLERMDAKITDLKNQIQVIQNPPPAPGAASPGTPGSTGQPQGTGAPPQGMSADRTFTDALRDFQTGKTDLAYNEFQQYLTYFPNTELAANAQFYIGEIAYNRGDYVAAVQAFDAVLERYPENPKTPDAHFMKGMALLKGRQASRAVQEFRALVQKYPHTDDARKAQEQLREMHASTASPPATTARRRPQ
ncbi:MAG: tetratricopeptide repeat protein [Acidobacteriaceae bacterium]|nr:tetratricopeptide repeat protein [Acidobacteriaceae bacterium]